MSKTIILTIPDSEIVPEIISTFTPEEIFLMLKIGSNCLYQGRKSVAGLTQKEIYQKIKEESKIEIENHRIATNNNPAMMEKFYDVISKYNLYDFTSDEVFEIIASMDEKEHELLSSIYLKSGFFHLGVVWIEAKQYIKIYNDNYDYIQKYNVSKEYKKGYFKLFLPKL